MPFRRRLPWLGPDLQTMRNALVPSSREMTAAADRLLDFPMSDGTGDRLTGRLTEPETADGGLPLVVLVHGLSGCEESAYMVETARYFHDRGYRVLRLNLRGSIPTRPHCSQHYHAGRDEDLAAVLDCLVDDSATANGLILMGYSLGGSVLLKFLAKRADPYPVGAAVVVSAPIDLAAATERFLQPRNWLYHRWILHHVKRDALALRGLSSRDARTIRTARTLTEFDDRFVAPRNGFDGARDYYHRCSGLRFLDDIRTPVLVIHALDDPWIPRGAYLEFEWRRNPFLTPLFATSGGHVGFHDAAGTWHNRMARLFVQRHTQPDGLPRSNFSRRPECLDASFA